MDLTDEMDAVDYAEAQKREETRCRLARGYASGDKARAAYTKAMDAVRRAEKAEEARQLKAKAKIQALRVEARDIHHELEYSSECKGTLLAHFVDKALLTERDKTRAALSKKAKLLRKAEGERDELQRVIDMRSPKKVPGVLRDRNGNARRQPADPNDPSALPPRLWGMVTNPNRWNSKEEEQAFMAKVASADLKVEEALIEVRKADKAYNTAEAALSEAFEAICGE